MKTPIIYIAGPYSCENEKVVQRRYESHLKYLAHLTSSNLVAFSPIVHSHPQVNQVTGTSWDFWKKFDETFLRLCSELHVLTLPGWSNSVGTRAEIALALGLGLPIRFVCEMDGNQEGYCECDPSPRALAIDLATRMQGGF